MKKLLSGILFAVLLLAPAVSWAGETDTCASSWTEETTYGGKALHKLGFGVKNTLLGWTELFTEAYRHHQENRSALAIGQGLGNAVMDTVGGVLHIVTAPLTGVDVPLPNGGVPCPVTGKK